MLTLDEVKRAIEEIESAKYDDEMAHSLEDTLHLQVLVAIADGATNAQELAKACLMTSNIDFCRWGA